MSDSTQPKQVKSITFENLRLTKFSNGMYQVEIPQTGISILNDDVGYCLLEAGRQLEKQQTTFNVTIGEMIHLMRETPDALASVEVCYTADEVFVTILGCKYMFPSVADQRTVRDAIDQNAWKFGTAWDWATEKAGRLADDIDIQMDIEDAEDYKATIDLL